LHQKEKQKALAELALVSDGIKYAKVGIDDAAAFTGNTSAPSTPECFQGRPLTRPR
jgi:hypothetical protein